MEKQTILIFEDDQDMRKELIRVFSIDAVLKDFQVLEAESVEQYYRIQEKCKLDILVLDMRLDRESVKDGGLRVLSLFQCFRKQNPASVAIVYTAYDSLDDCVMVMRAGAWDYIDKNESRSIRKLVTSIKDALEMRFSKTEGPNSKWLEEHLPSLTRNYGGKWTAFVDSQPVDSGGNLQELKSRVASKYLGRSHYILYIPREI